LAIGDLPLEVPVHILSGLPSSALMAVCRAWRRLYHERARSVVLTLGPDTASVTALRGCTSLLHLTAWAPQQWPTGALMQL